MLDYREIKAPKILVAMPKLKDGYFEKSVILLCEYNADGAMGFVVNIPSATSIDDLMQELNIAAPNLQPESVLVGGPVQPEFCWALHTTDYTAESSTPIGKRLSLSSVSDVLLSICKGKAPEEYILGVGYAGWGPGQLDEEIEQESWWLADMDPIPLLQTNCENRWELTMNSLGLTNASQLNFCKA